MQTATKTTPRVPTVVHRPMARPGALTTELAALKYLPAETTAELDALLPALLDRAFKGEL